MNFELRQKLERVARRIRSLRLWSGLALCWLLWAAIGAAVLAAARHAGWSIPIAAGDLAMLATLSAIACVFASLRSARDQRTVARRIEARHPELGTLLLAAIEQADLPRERLGFLQTTVIRDAVEHGRRHNWTNAISTWKIRLAKFLQFAALGLLVCVCIGLANRVGAHSGLGSALFGIGRGATGDLGVEIDPGNAEIERGTSLLVVANFPGIVPADATLVTTGNADGTQAHDMIRSLDDPKFAARIAEVNEPMSYHVEFTGGRSETYRIKVFDYPELVRADAKLEYPKYTSLEPALVEDVRHITAAEGTQLTLICRLNKVVAEARLLGTEGQTADLKPDPSDAKVYSLSWKLIKSRRLKVRLVDAEGRESRLPAEIVVNVTPNRPPTIAIDRPARDVEVSPLEELQLKAAVSDDFGVLRSGVSYSTGGEKPREVVLASEPSIAKEQTVERIIDFESLEVEPDQLVSYFVWAEDSGPDGALRRTLSDMYFAEVRPFDQIFRQGEQPAQNEQQQQQRQGGNSQDVGELAELQKEIINATWKLVRRETAAEPTQEFASDSRLLRDSQESALERSAVLSERLEDSESRAHLESAQSHMQEALSELTSAAKAPTVEPLEPALAAEQAAYQDLLKLRAREFQVVRGSRQRGERGENRGSRSQRQLQELELSADENRYETQRSATAPEESASQRKSREILNRLRDLARRQDDLNDRLRELQSALEQAQTPREREELERELKRLRDQQQEILRDTDELIGQVDRSQNAAQAQNARQRLEESRSRVQQASEALQEGQLSQALTEGTRAGRQLSELRDEFRRQSANRFTEDLTEMRRAARNLDEEQQRLSEQLNQQNAESSRTLRDSGERAEMQEGLNTQRQQLRKLTDRMRQTIEEAEEPEPLLARQLYDAIRETHQQRLDDALEMSRRLVDIGARPQAGEAMRVADRGIDRLRQGVERAAESVLGDETESLRRAKREVEQLANELDREINASQGDNSADDRNQEQTGTQRQNDRDPNRSETPAQSNDGEQRPGSSPPPAGNTNERRRSSLRGGGNRANRGGGLERLFEQSGERAAGFTPAVRGPITGRDFRDWADRLRDVEEMLDDAELRGEAARIRDRAEDARADFKRHSKMPDWSQLQDLLHEPLVELSQRIGAEIRRKESPDALVPIDRDPVPPEFVEPVRRYYERLGSGE